MRDEIGKWILPGIEEGIKVTKNKFNKSMDRTFDDMTADWSTKMQASVNFSNINAIPPSVSNVTTTAATTNNYQTNDNGFTLNIDNFNNNTDSDIETLANELAFYITRTNRMR